MRAARRRARIDRILATRRAVRTPSPELVKQAALRLWEDRHEEDGEDGEDGEDAAGAGAEAGAEAEQEEEAAEDVRSAEEIEQAQREAAADLTKVLAASMGWYTEFPHVDGRFIQVYYTLPGFTPGLGTAEFAEEGGE